MEENTQPPQTQPEIQPIQPKIPKKWLIVLIIVVLLVGGYFALAKFYFHTWPFEKVAVSPTPLSAEGCNLLVGTRDDKRINLFFLPPHDYNKTSNELANYSNLITTIAGGLFTIRPFDNNRDKFNIYFLDVLPNFNCEVGGNNCDEEKLEQLAINKCQVSREDVHQIVALGGSDTGGATRSGRPLGYGFITFNINDNGIVLAHELGHSMANFGEEYFSGSVRSASIVAGANLDVKGCPKWCSGKLDESNEFYKYYSGWENCILSKGLDLNPTKIKIVEPGEDEMWNSCWDEWAEKYYNAANSPNFIEACPFKPPASPQNLTLGTRTGFDCENVKTFDNLNLGKDCIGQTGCFFTASGVNECRQLENSIMRTETMASIERLKSVRFGDYSEIILQDVINNLIWISRQ